MPESGSIIRLIMRRLVDFPQPEGPMSTQTSPSRMSSVRSATAALSAPS
jgi:hypothetical protein